MDGARLGLAGSRRFVAIVGALVVAGGGALGWLRFAGSDPPLRGLEAAAGALALGAVMAVPGVLALLSLADRPALLLPAGVLLVPLSFVSFAGVTLPLLVPAVMLLVAYGRRSVGCRRAYAGQAGVCTVVVLVLVVVAFVALFAHDDPRSWSTATGGGSTSDVITVAESAVSLALSAAAVGSGWFLARPYR
ncbi:MAG TPA: hypothetical protein VHG90_12300 [Acidimicrobiales bacterium]|nr:hypothetical protein [Acidimicrobiales bacterium]